MLQSIKNIININQKDTYKPDTKLNNTYRNEWINKRKENMEKNSAIFSEIFKDNNLDRNKCPETITLEMLEYELGIESTFYNKEDANAKDLLWGQLYHLMKDLDKYGFYVDKYEENAIVPNLEPYEKYRTKTNAFLLELEKPVKTEKPIELEKPVPLETTNPLLQGGKQKTLRRKSQKSKKSRKSKKNRKTTRKYVGGTAFNQLTYNNSATIPLNFRRSANEHWHTITKIHGLNIYGSSLPKFQFDGFGNPFSESDTWDAYKNFIFFLTVLNIRTIISLQGCSDPRIRTPGGLDLPGVSNNTTCRNYRPIGPYGHTWEDDFYDAAKQHLDGLKDEFRTQAALDAMRFRNITISDMAVGSSNAWVQLAQVPDTRLNPTSTLIHCYAGYGRTGTALLFYLMRDINVITARLNLPDGFLGFGNSANMYNALYMALNTNLEYPPEGDGPQQTNIRRFNKQNAVDEVFDINSLACAVRFVARMNNILFCIGAVRQIPNIPIYTIPTGLRNPGNIFQLSYRVPAPDFTNVIPNPWGIAPGILGIDV